MNLIYRQTREDFYFQSLSSIDYAAQIEILTQEGFLGFSEKRGFVQLSLLEKIIAVAKGILGFHNEIKEERLNAEKLKFLYYGESRGFLNQSKLRQLKPIFSSSISHHSVRFLFQQIEQNHTTSSKIPLENMRAILINYHIKESDHLKPSFWNRCKQRPDLNAHACHHFGDTALILAQQALDPIKFNIKAAYQFILEAYEHQNLHPEFQRKIALVLKQVVEKHLDDPFIQAKKLEMHKIWLKLIQVAYTNQQLEQTEEYIQLLLRTSPNEEIKNEIGKLCLKHQQYEQALPFLPTLQRTTTQQPDYQLQIARAYLHLNKKVEGIQIFEATLPSLTHLSSSSQNVESLINIHLEIGRFYQEREDLEDSIRFVKVIEHFEKALHLIKDFPRFQHLQPNLTKAVQAIYHTKWVNSSNDFYQNEALKWQAFLSFCPTEQEQVKAMLLATAEYFFQMHDHPKGLSFLLNGISFESDPNYLLKKLSFIHDYHLTTNAADLKKWEKQFYNDPRILEKIGDIYASINPSKRLPIYQTALTQAKKLSTTAPDPTIYEPLISSLFAKIASLLLASPGGFFTSTSDSYDQAITILEEAYRVDPESNRRKLFEAYLKRAKEEQEKNWFSRDQAKIIVYYQKAYDLTHENGPYIAELMTIYLAANSFDKALTLLMDIEKQSWVNVSPLTKEHYYSLSRGIKPLNLNMAFKCAEKAFQIDSSNKEFKKQLYELGKEWAEELLARTISLTDPNRKIQYLQLLAKKLSALIDSSKNFEYISSLEKDYRSTIAKVYHEIALYYVKQFELNTSEAEMRSQKLMSGYIEQFKNEITAALNYYQKAISYHEENPALHFEYGLILELISEFELALAQYQLATKYNPTNLFYKYRLEKTVRITTGDLYEDRDQLESTYGQTFLDAYMQWNEEHFLKTKPHKIDPHKNPTTRNGILSFLGILN